MFGSDVYWIPCVMNRYLAGAEDSEAIGMRLEADLQLFLDTSIGVLPRWVVRHGGTTLDRAERPAQRLSERSDQRRYLQHVYPRQATALLLEQQNRIFTERIRLFEIRSGVAKQVHVMLIENLYCRYLFCHIAMAG